MAKSKLNTNEPWQMDGARKRIDHIIRELIDQLDDCYYGTPNGTGRLQDGWRHGISKPFFIWDFVAGQDNKLKFDLLSGTIHHLHFLVQHLFNCDHVFGGYEKTPEPEYNWIRDSNNQFVETKVQDSKRWIRNMATIWNNAGLTPAMNRTRRNQIINYIRNRPVIADVLSRRADLDPILDPENTTDQS